MFVIFGERIRKLRKERGMTLRELSNELGIPFTTLGNYEREDREPNFETLKIIADYFEVSIDYLTGRLNGKTISPLALKIFNESLERSSQDDSNPESRILSNGIFSKIATITHSNTKKQNVRELEIIAEIVDFIFSMKNKFAEFENTENIAASFTTNELAQTYIREKHRLDGLLNELFEIYLKEK